MDLWKGHKDYPDITEFLEYDENRRVKPLLKPQTATLFANCLLAFHVKRIINDTHLKVMNTSRNNDKAVELAIQWFDEDPDRGNYAMPHWDLTQFNCEESAVLAKVMDEWYEDCKRYPQLKRHNMVLQSEIRARKAASEYILGKCASHISHLEKFDNTNVTRRALYSGFVFQPFEEEPGKFVLDRGENKPEYMLLTDTDAFETNDKKYEKELKWWLAYLDSLFPGYRKQEEDQDPSMHGNYAIDVLGEQLAKAFLPTKLREVTFLTGRGKNGKSILVEILMHAFSNTANRWLSPAKEVTGEIFADESSSGSAENKQKGDRSALRGARLVFCTEMNQGRLDGDFIKPLAAGELIKGGGNFKANEDLRLHCSCFICTNNPPRFREDTLGIERRCVVIKFERTFEEGEPGTKKDTDLLEKGKKIKGTILRWVFDIIWKKIEQDSLKFPDKLPGRLEDDRQDILDKGRDPVLVALEKFLVPGKTKQKMLLGGSSEKHGITIGKKGFYGIALAVKLICEEQGLMMSRYPNPRIERMVDRVGGELYAGNAKKYKNLTHSPEMEKFLRDMTEDPEAINYLYNWKGFSEDPFSPAPAAPEVPPESELSI